MIIPIIFTLNPVYDDNLTLTWVFHKMVSFCKDNKWPLIAQEQYFYNIDKQREKAAWVFTKETSLNYDYDFPQPYFLKEIKPIVIPKDVEQRFIEKQPSITDAYMKSIVDDWDEMEDYLVSSILEMCKTMGEVEAILALNPHKFIDNVAERLGTETLYFEWGPFRGPVYRNTGYLDFDGNQGKSSIGKRYKNFLRETEKQTVPIFERKEILSLFLKEEYSSYYEIDESAPPIYEAGIIGGYNIPSVTTPYNSITLEEMIARTKNVFDGQSIAVRLHPGDPIKARPYNVTIETCPLVEFILKCKRIVCNASNVSYEAALYGRIPYDLGWSQFGFAVNTSIEKLEDLPMTTSALNFIAFGALIPWELLKNIEYLRFRLSNPSEREIYLYHLQYYLSSCNIKDEYMPTRFQKVMEKVKNFENLFHEPYLIEDTVWSGRNSIAVKEIEINRLLKTIEVLEKSKSNIIEEMKKSSLLQIRILWNCCVKKKSISCKI